MDTIPLDKESILGYLDECITTWRLKRRDAAPGSEDELMAMCYVDAYQSVRASLFDELLPFTE
jgi:hypothetical protein